jgi:uncharacterized membrane protein
MPVTTLHRMESARELPLHAPLSWLARGWRDLWRCPLPGLVHGAVVAGFGGLLLALAHDRFWLLAGAFSGFLLVAPLIATGLYAVSRELEAGRHAGLMTALATWRPRDRRLVLFGALLALAGTGWVLTSAALITYVADQPVTSPLRFLHVVVLGPGWLFEAWLLLGGALAAPIFASSVVTIPLLLDRPLGVRDAVLASASAVTRNPVPLALWALLIMALSLAGGLLLMAGLAIVVPWLAHASWHAYRDLMPREDVRR